MSATTTRRLLQGLAVCGIGVAGYLLFSKLMSAYFCPVGDCQTVNNSAYAQLFGLPVSLYGLFFYVAVIGLVQAGANGSRLPWRLLGWMLPGGLLFSLYLTIIEVAVLHAVCIWCMISFGIVVLMNVLYWYPSLFAGKKGKKGDLLT